MVCGGEERKRERKILEEKDFGDEVGVRFNTYSFNTWFLTDTTNLIKMAKKSKNIESLVFILLLNNVKRDN